METVFVLQSLYWDRMMWWNIPDKTSDLAVNQGMFAVTLK